MDDKQKEDNKQEFLKLVKDNIHREGIDELMNWLVTTDFFDAPASSKFHMAEAGGLCKHSLNV